MLLARLGEGGKGRNNQHLERSRWARSLTASRHKKGFSDFFRGDLPNTEEKNDDNQREVSEKKEGNVRLELLGKRRPEETASRPLNSTSSKKRFRKNRTLFGRKGGRCKKKRCYGWKPEIPPEKGILKINLSLRKECIAGTKRNDWVGRRKGGKLKPGQDQLKA